MIAAIIHDLTNKNNTKTLKFNICLLYSAINSKITLKSIVSYHRTSNAAAKVSGLTEGPPEVSAAIIQNLRYKNHTTKLKSAVNSRIYTAVHSALFYALLRRQFQDLH